MTCSIKGLHIEHSIPSQTSYALFQFGMDSEPPSTFLKLGFSSSNRRMSWCHKSLLPLFHFFWRSIRWWICWLSMPLVIWWCQLTCRVILEVFPFQGVRILWIIILYMNLFCKWSLCKSLFWLLDIVWQDFIWSLWGYFINTYLWLVVFYEQLAWIPTICNFVCPSVIVIYICIALKLVVIKIHGSLLEGG